VVVSNAFEQYTQPPFELETLSDMGYYQKAWLDMHGMMRLVECIVYFNQEGSFFGSSKFFTCEIQIFLWLWRWRVLLFLLSTF
jgi:hypothetical protein